MRFKPGFDGVVAWGLLGLLLAVPLVLPAPLTALHATGLMCARPFRVAGTSVRVIDGDTLTTRLRIWLGTDQEETIRLLGVDTPELRGLDRERAVAATAFTKAWVESAVQIIVSVCSRDSFGRLLAVVERDGDSVNLADALIRAGHGVKR